MCNVTWPDPTTVKRPWHFIYVCAPKFAFSLPFPCSLHNPSTHTFEGREVVNTSGKIDRESCRCEGHGNSSTGFNLKTCLVGEQLVYEKGAELLRICKLKKKKSYNRINRYTWGRGRVSCRVFMKCRDLPARERVYACMQDHARVTKIRGENRKGAVDQADRTEARKCLSVPGEPLWNVRLCICPPAWAEMKVGSGSRWR